MPCQCSTDRQRSKCVNWIGPEVGLLETDGKGNFRATTGCYPEIVLRFLTDLIRRTVGAASAIEDARNHFGNAGQAMQNYAMAIAQLANSTPLLPSNKETDDE